jgi:hypothetical protein
MIKVEGRNIWRNGEKIGYIGSGHVIDHAGEKIGAYTQENIYDRTGHKVASITDDYVYVVGSSKIRIEDIIKEVPGGTLTNIERAAVRILLGE